MQPARDADGAQRGGHGEYQYEHGGYAGYDHDGGGGGAAPFVFGHGAGSSEPPSAFEYAQAAQTRLGSVVSI